MRGIGARRTDDLWEGTDGKDSRPDLYGRAEIQNAGQAGRKDHSRNHQRRATLIGFARVISDYATSYYLCDVIIDPEYRHRGLGTALVSHVVTSPEYTKLRGFLITRDAHDLYRKFGFEVVDGRVMVKAPE